MLRESVACGTRGFRVGEVIGAEEEAEVGAVAVGAEEAEEEEDGAAVVVGARCELLFGISFLGTFVERIGSVTSTMFPADNDLPLLFKSFLSFSSPASTSSIPSIGSNPAPCSNSDA